MAETSDVVATSQTRWRDLPRTWRDTAVDAVVDSGRGDTPMAVIAVIAAALYDRFGRCTGVDGQLPCWLPAGHDGEHHG